MNPPSKNARFLLTAFLAFLLPGGFTATIRADILYTTSGAFGNSVRTYPTGGGAGSVFASTGLISPTSLAFDNAGNLFVANNGIVGGQPSPIIKVSPAGVPTFFATVGLVNLGGLAFDSAGDLYAAITSTHTIMRFTPAGVASVFASTGLNLPNGLAFDSAGNLYVANSGDNSIVTFTPGGIGSVFANTGLDLPAALAFDRLGNLYASNVGRSATIQQFTPEGVGSVFANAQDGVFQPAAIAFDSEGLLYLANSGGGPMVRLTPEGAYSFFFTPGSVNPQGLAFTDNAGHPLKLANQIPEPSILGILAASGVALVMRRRRTVTQA